MTQENKNHANHLMTQIPATNRSKIAEVYFDGELFSTIQMEPIKLPCKYYNLVFLAIEKWNDAELTKEEQMVMELMNRPFSSILQVMNTTLGEEKAEELIRQNEMLGMFTVKLKSGIII